MIDYRIHEDTARITFAAPSTANAITVAMMQDYIQALEAAQTSGARFLVIDSKGDDFTVGRDQKEKGHGLTRLQSLNLILRANAALRAFEGVSIALIRGRALGFGSGISLHSTISIAADNATFGFDEIAHELAPLVIVAYAPYFIAPRIAQELVITGRPVSAQEAREIGLTSRVVVADSLDEAAESLIESLRGRHQGAIRLLRKYHESQAAYPSDAVLQDAIAQLSDWIEAGKP